MGIIMRKGIAYGGSGGGSADAISYDNSASGLEAENVQEAVDLLSSEIAVLQTALGTNLAEVADLVGG